MKVEKITKVKGTSLLLANQAGQLVKVANSFGSKISISYGEYTLNAKSLLGMLMLTVKVGDELTFAADGDDAEEAVEELSKLI